MSENEVLIEHQRLIDELGAAARATDVGEAAAKERVEQLLDALDQPWFERARAWEAARSHEKES